MNYKNKIRQKNIYLNKVFYCFYDLLLKDKIFIYFRKA